MDIVIWISMGMSTYGEMERNLCTVCGVWRKIKRMKDFVWNKINPENERQKGLIGHL